MLAYAASRPVVVDRRPHPNAMLLIIGAHVAALALVMSARMDLPIIHHPPRTTVFWVPQPRTPPPPPIGGKSASHPSIDNSFDRADTKVIVPPTSNTGPDLGPKPNPGTLGGGGALTIPDLTPLKVTIGKTNAQLLTPASELKPPYPASKLDSGEEAVLMLRLRIDESGHVVAVDPVGRADAVFLEAARRYLVAHWRYRPATEDGQAVASSMVITLHFELNG